MTCELILFRKTASRATVFICVTATDHWSCRSGGTPSVLAAFESEASSTVVEASVVAAVVDAVVVAAAAAALW